MIKFKALIAGLALALMAGVAQASIVTAELDGVVINGVTYNVTFSQDSDGLTAFNDVFGSGSPTLTFTTAGAAFAAATDLLARVNFLNIDVTPANSPNQFSLPYSYDSGQYFTYVAFSNGVVPLYNPPNSTVGFNADRNDSSYTGSFATFAIAVPEPETYAMLLAGLGLMGFVSRRRKQRAA